MSVLRSDARRDGSVVPAVSLEVDDVHSSHAAARAAGAELMHEMIEELWGVRRFFVRDPSGHVLNILAHC